MFVSLTAAALQLISERFVTVAGVPQKVKVLSLTRSSLLVVWRRPSPANGRITHYTVTIKDTTTKETVGLHTFFGRGLRGEGGSNCFETVLKLFWNCSEIILKLLWNWSEIARKLLGNCSKTALKLLWNCSEIALKLLGNCSKTARKFVRNSSETARKLLWNWSEIILKLLWNWSEITRKLLGNCS